MTPEEIYWSLISRRKEMEGKAIQKYQMGFGLPYTDELREMDKQIEEASKRLSSSFFDNLLVDNPKKEKSNFPINNPKDLETAVRIKQIEDKIEKEHKEISAAEQKKLYVLKKLKEEWDLIDKEAGGAIQTDISWQETDKWLAEGEMSHEQLNNILKGFKNKGLLKEAHFYNPAV